MHTLPEKFNYPFSYAPHPLVREAAERLISHIAQTPQLDSAFAEGKMLGILLVRRKDGSVDSLAAFSGSVTVVDDYGRSHLTNSLDGFVPPIYDLLDPNGHFKQKEAEISHLNYRIHRLSKSAAASGLSVSTGQEGESLGAADELQLLKARRKELSEYLQKWIFDQYLVLNGRGERLTLTEIFARKALVPPGGTGDCALPKLLQYAYQNGLRPLAFGEFWYGRSRGREVRVQGAFYPSCTGKCGPLLDYMLQGVDVEEDPLALSHAGFDTPESIEERIVYEDDTLIAVDKPSGLLSVPGKDKSRPSLLALLQRRANRAAAAAITASTVTARSSSAAKPVATERSSSAAKAVVTEQPSSEAKPVAPRRGPTIYPVHRLDMHTSGLIIFAKSAEAQAELMHQFEERGISKTYLARLLPGPPIPEHGCIELPLSPDFYDRPRQIVDREDGKHAMTHFELLEEYDNGEVLVRFFPKTGRTHQLRVHSAHQEGLGRPIKGDLLYGGASADSGHLCLTAETLTFVHPVSGETISLKIPCRMA